MRIGIKLIIGCLIAFAITHFEAHAQTGTGKQAFYSAIASGSTTAWNKQLEAVNTMSGNDKKAFQGALLMRKSGVQKTPGQKLSMFKQGHKLLEAAISHEAQNPEYRFLRLMIQENAPKIVGYNNNIADDARLVKASFKSLPETVQKAVLSYSQTSKALNGLQ
jgi:hypothetical protein